VYQRQENWEVNMRPKLTWFMLCSGAIAIAVVYHSQFVLATPANSGFKATAIASGTFGEFQVLNQLAKDMLPIGNDDDLWLSLQKTKGRSDLYVQSNTWQSVDPVTGVIASTGWHTHPGHSLIIVTAGTVTEYEADCTPHVYGKGATFVDPGGDHVHIIRNESPTNTASTVAVQLVPFDPNKANRRIDAPAPENCQSIF
jgi:hypothetical protein